MTKLIKFGFVGVLNTLITMGVYNLLIYLGINIYVANTIGYICGITNSYIWNNIWVFQAKSKEIKTVAKFIIINIFTWSINTFVLFLLAKKVGLNPTIAQVISTMFTMCLNFIGNQFWTFKKRNNI